jgi:5-hydroxyisourate hydrolase
MTVKLQSIDGGHLRTFKKVTLNTDVRADGGPLLGSLSMRTGRYRLVFSVTNYFRAKGVQLPSLPFIDEEPTDFEIAEPEGHYDAPLLVSPGAIQPTAGLECDTLSLKYSIR